MSVVYPRWLEMQVDPWVLKGGERLAGGVLMEMMCVKRTCEAGTGGVRGLLKQLPGQGCCLSCDRERGAPPCRTTVVPFLLPCCGARCC